MKILLAPLCALSLSACQLTLDPPESADYLAQDGLDRDSASLAQRCARPATPVPEQPLRLPPGCANDANLAQMVERREDLRHGRATGPTLAAPVGRAAHDYLGGARSGEQRERHQEQAAQVDTGAGQ